MLAGEMWLWAARLCMVALAMRYIRLLWRTPQNWPGECSETISVVEPAYYCEL